MLSTFSECHSTKYTYFYVVSEYLKAVCEEVIRATLLLNNVAVTFGQLLRRYIRLKKL